MNEDERDIVEFTDEEGNSILLEVLDTFFYNGEEFAVLADAIDEDEEAALCGECGQPDESGEGCACGCCGCGAAEGDEEDEGEDVYLMKIVPSTNEDGEEMEEFVPVEDDDLMEKLIEIVQTRFGEDDEDDE